VHQTRDPCLAQCLESMQCRTGLLFSHHLVVFLLFLGYALVHLFNSPTLRTEKFNHLPVLHPVNINHPLITDSISNFVIVFLNCLCSYSAIQPQVCNIKLTISVSVSVQQNISATK